MQTISSLSRPPARSFRLRGAAGGQPGLAALVIAGVLAASGGLVTLAGVPGLSDARGVAPLVDQQELRQVTSLRRVALDPAVAPALVAVGDIWATAGGDAATDMLAALPASGSDAMARAGAGATAIAEGAAVQSVSEE